MSLLDSVHLLHHTQKLHILCLSGRNQSKNQWTCDWVFLATMLSLFINDYDFRAFQWLGGKETACQAGDMGLIPGSGRFSGEGNGNPLQYSCPPGSSLHAIFQAGILEQVATSYTRRIPWQRRLVGYSPWGHKESDTNEHARTYFRYFSTK